MATLILTGCETGPRIEPLPFYRVPAASTDDGPPNLWQTYATVEQKLVTQGRLREDDGGGTPDVAALVRDFTAIAFMSEYARGQEGLVPIAQAAPLQRWQVPIRIRPVWGPGVPRARTRADAAALNETAKQIRKATGHDVRVNSSRGNVVVLFASEAERRARADDLDTLITGIPESDAAIIRELPESTYCAAFPYAAGPDAPYNTALIVIRDELPARLRRSCIDEELAQVMGLANDSPAARPSVFNDDEEFARLTTHDEALLAMLYDPRLRTGMAAAEARPLLPEIAADHMR